MLGHRMLGLVIVASLLGGCAGGGQTRKAMSQLQSQVGMLEERVAQLEHASTGTIAVAPLSSSAEEPMAAIQVEPVKSKKAAKSGSKTSSASASIKPSTREIQQALKNAGFYQGEIDGKMGPLTKDAVKEFQRVHGLTDDGTVGKQTWAKLGAYSDLSSVASSDATAAEVLK